MVHPGGRPKNPIFWRHVEVDGNNHKKVKCKHCGKEFAKSVQRIKTHLTGEGKGVLPCKPNVIEFIRNEVAAGEHGNAGVNDNNNMNIDVMNPGTDMEAAYDGTQAMPEIAIQSNLDPVIQSTSRADNMGLGADDNAAIRESTGEDVCAVTTSIDAAMFLQPIASQNVPAGEKLPATASRDAAAPARPATLPNVSLVTWPTFMGDFDRAFPKKYVFGEATDAADPSHSDSVQLSRDYLNNPSGQAESSPQDPLVSSNFAAKSPSHESSPQDPPGLGADDNAATHESTGEDVCAVTSRDAAVFLPPIDSQNVSLESATCRSLEDAIIPVFVSAADMRGLETTTDNNVASRGECNVHAGEKLPAVTSSDAAEPAWAATVRDMPLYSNTPAFMGDYRRHPPISSNFAAKSPSIHDEQVGRDPAAMLPSYEHEEEPADSRRDVVVSTSAASSFDNFAAKLPSIVTLSSNDEQHPPAAAAALQNEPPVSGNASAKLPSIHEQAGGTVAAATLQNEEPADMEGCNSFSAACEELRTNDCSSRFDNQVYLQAMQNPNKRVRLQDSSLASSSNDAETIVKRAVEDHVAVAFLKFLYCNDVPSVANDLVTDPLYMEFVERASQLGFPPSLVWGGSRFIRSTVSRIEYEVNEYIHHVKESWKTTGCTVMLFNLQLLPTREDVTTVFYCPKGVFFAQGNVVQDFYAEHVDVDVLSHNNCIKLDHYLDYIGEKYIGEEYIGEDHLCELTDITIIEKQNRRTARPLCIRNQIHNCCIIACHHSKWADNLISIAGKIHTILCSSRQIQSWYYKMLRRERSSFKVLANNHCPRANRFAIFISIQSICRELALKLDPGSARDEITAILEGTKFESVGRKLGRTLEFVMKIGDVMDTFVPTAGYLTLALYEVDRNVRLFFALDTDKDDHLRFWKKLKSTIKFSYDYFEDAGIHVNDLNPVHYLQQLQKDSQKQKYLKERLRDIFDGVDCYDEEVDRYADEFRKVPADYKLEQHHPVEVWEKYGKSLPNLQRVAIKALSRPLSCMCKQVKKHLYQLEGAEDYILKLNVRMMQHFKLLGDDIYKPIDLSPLRKGYIWYDFVTLESESDSGWESDSE